jgi:hypothetical protein
MQPGGFFLIRKCRYNSRTGFVTFRMFKGLQFVRPQHRGVTLSLQTTVRPLWVRAWAGDKKVRRWWGWTQSERDVLPAVRQIRIVWEGCFWRLLSCRSGLFFTWSIFGSSNRSKVFVSCFLIFFCIKCSFLWDGVWLPLLSVVDPDPLFAGADLWKSNL